MTITEFLEARIAEDEAAARRAAEVFPGSWDIEDRGHHAHVVCDGPNFHYVSELDQKQAPDVDWLGGALQNIANYQPARVLAECAAKRVIMAELTPPALPEWTPDCGGDWCLSSGNSEGPGITFFANYWPDHTVSASIYADGHAVHKSGIVARQTKIECQFFAERWIVEHLSVANPTVRALAAIYASNPDYQQEWS